MEAAQFSRTGRFRIRNDSVVFLVLHTDYGHITAWWTPISRVLHNSVHMLLHRFVWQIYTERRFVVRLLLTILSSSPHNTVQYTLYR